jgi:NADPH-dependent 2,4-dienoyl-CoA reductase/sulfur reductase-like enzyme
MPITFIPEPHLLDSPRGRPWPRPPAGGATTAAVGRPPATADVAIVGAGPAGLAVASALWHLGVSDVVLFDQADRPCGRFFDRIDVLRQRVLRSPYEHHPGVEGYRDCELLDFARLHWGLLTGVERREIRMAQAGHRSVVPVDVFEAFCRHVAAVHRVPERTWRAAVSTVRPAGHAVTLRAGGFEVRAAFAVLCTGEQRRAAPATWWDGERPPAGVRYWDEPVPPGPERLVVIGAGLTAAHLIANALAEGRQVHWVVRATAERYQCSDVNSAFFRAEGRARFDGVPWHDRLAVMRMQRRASVMFEFRPLLRRAEADGRLVVHRGQAVTRVTARAGAGAAVHLATGRRITGDHVVLALGTTVSNGDRLLPARLVAARDGWPDLDERTLAYRRAPRVFAVGAAAGMVLGPAARNIDGHRVATARVATAIAAGLGGERPAVPGAAGEAIAHV